MRSMNYFSVSTKAFSTADQAYHNKLIMKKAAVFPLPLSLISNLYLQSVSGMSSSVTKTVGNPLVKVAGHKKINASLKR